MLAIVYGIYKSFLLSYTRSVMCLRFKKMLAQVVYVLVVKVVQRNKMMEDFRTGVMTLHVCTKSFQLYLSGVIMVPLMDVMSPLF